MMVRPNHASIYLYWGQSISIQVHKKSGIVFFYSVKPDRDSSTKRRIFLVHAQSYESEPQLFQPKKIK
jgi:hypothetical protein